MSWRRTILVTLLATAATAGAAHGATIPVTTTLDGPITDQPAQDGLCSLREAMAAAASTPPCRAARRARAPTS